MGVVDRQSMKAHMTKSFVLLMLLASSAFAAELSLQQQLDAVQAELAASQAHNKQLLSEVEKLKNEKLVGLDGGTQDVDESDPDSELASGTTEDVGVCSPAGGVETGREIGKMWGVSWNARVSLATIKMIKCWQHVCKGTPMKKLKGKKTDKKKGSVKDEEETILDLDALLDEDEAAETNAGWDCG